MPFLPPAKESQVRPPRTERPERDRDVQRSANKPVQTLIKHISSGAAARLVIPDSAAFHRLGPDLLLPLCAQFHVEIVIANLP